MLELLEGMLAVIEIKRKKGDKRGLCADEDDK